MKIIKNCSTKFKTIRLKHNELSDLRTHFIYNKMSLTPSLGTMAMAKAHIARNTSSPRLMVTKMSFWTESRVGAKKSLVCARTERAGVASAGGRGVISTTDKSAAGRRSGRNAAPPLNIFLTKSPLQYYDTIIYPYYCLL